MKKNGRPEMIGVTPGRISIARKGSPKVPGISRTSARESEAVRDGSPCAPRMVTSSNSAALFRFAAGRAGAVEGAAAGAVREFSPDGMTFGWKNTSKWILATMA